MREHKPSDEQLIRDIVDRYGDKIDLRKTPHLILEIIRNYAGGVADVPDGGVSVAGVGTPPGPKKDGTMGSIGNVVDNAQLMKELLKLSRQLNALSEDVQQLKR